jgi:hypothetical protein
MPEGGWSGESSDSEVNGFAPRLQSRGEPVDGVESRRCAATSGVRQHLDELDDEVWGAFYSHPLAAPRGSMVPIASIS